MSSKKKQDEVVDQASQSEARPEPSQEDATGVHIVSKISLNTMGFVKMRIQKALEGKNEGHKVELAHMLGKASDLRAFQDKNSGDTGYALRGMFEATDMTTGDVYQSGQMFIPGSAIHGMVVEKVKALQDGESVEFAFQANAIKQESSPVGYRFEIISLIPVSPVDALTELRNRSKERLLLN